MKVRFCPEDPSNSTPWLTVGNLYDVIGIEADDFRIMNDVGEPCLYEAHLFSVEDAEEPEEWATSYGEEGERYSYPPQLGEPGFVEDWHDGDARAKRTLTQYLRAKMMRSLEHGEE